MKKTTIFLTIALLLVTSCSRSDVSNSNSGDVLFPSFMIGKWISGGVQVTDTFGNYHHEYRVEFISESRLKFCDINSSESFCADFNYRLISGKTYLVENDRAKDGHWEISREGDRLLICIWENGNCVLFSRDTTSR